MANSQEIGTVYLKVDAKPDSGFASEIEDAAGKAGGSAGELFGGEMGAKLKAMAPAAFAALAAAAGKALYSIGEDFDRMYDTIAIGTGATGDALESLNESARNVMSDVPASIDDVASTVADLNTRLGVSGDELEGLAAQYLQASRMVGEVDISKTTAAFNAFGLEGEAVSDALDDLFTVSQSTGIGMNELASAVQANAAPMQMLGFSFQETAAMVGAFDKAGLNSQQILSSMSKGLVNLAKDGEQPQEAFRRVTSELQALVDKGDEAAALDMASELFGTRGAAQFVGALKSGAMGIDDLTAALEGNQSAIMETANATMSAQERFQIMGNKLQVAIEPLASAVFNLVADIAEGLIPVIERIAPVISGVASFVGDVIKTVVSGVGALLETIGGFVDSIVAFFSGDGDILSTVGEFVSTLGSRALEAGGQFMASLLDGLGSAIGSLLGWFSSLPGQIVAAIGDPLTILHDVGMNIIQGAINGIGALAGALWSKVTSIFAGAVDSAEEAVDSHSPSRLFREIGQNMVIGAELGIEDEDLSFQTTVRSTMLNAASAAPTGFSGISAGGQTINIENMTVEANDVDEFVLSVERRLGRLAVM